MYYYHEFSEPATSALKDFHFDAVIFDTSTSSFRTRTPHYKFLADKERYSFISDWDAVKVAFPQDEYDGSAILDDWLADYRFDVIYSNLCQHSAMFYPRMSKQARILPALTGYVNDADIDGLSAFAKPFAERQVDIGYRARFLPARFGRHGQMKGLLAGRMLKAVNGHEIVTDISTEPNQVFLGDDWQRFLGDCRFCPGSETGSSVWDPEGKIAERTARFTRANPDASFEEIEAACFPGEDRRWDFSAISPRIFEAAIMRCGQILVEGSYLEEMEPWRHYLPIDEHCETMPEILSRMQDGVAMERMIDECHDVLIASPRYRYSTHVAEVMNQITDIVAEKRVQSASAEEFESMVDRHRKMLPDELRRARSRATRMKRSVAKWRWRIQTMLPAK